MEAIRAIVAVHDHQLVMKLPKAFDYDQVEVLVLPIATPLPHQPRRSLRGSLHAYADPRRLRQEQTAWTKAMRRKHETR